MFSEKTSSKQAIAQSSPQTRSRSIPTASFEKKQQDKFQEAKGDDWWTVEQHIWGICY